MDADKTGSGPEETGQTVPGPRPRRWRTRIILMALLLLMGGAAYLYFASQTDCCAQTDRDGLPPMTATPPVP